MHYNDGSDDIVPFVILCHLHYYLIFHPSRQSEMELHITNPSAHEYVVKDHIEYTMSCFLQLYIMLC